MNLVDNLLAHARTRGSHPALIHGARTVDYRELGNIVARNARVLSQRGVGKGDVVGVCLGDHIEHLVLLHAVAMVGAIILPMDVRWTADEKVRVARHFEAKMVLVDPGAAPLTETPIAVVDAGWHADAASAAPFTAIPRGPDLPLLLSLSSGTTGTPKGPLITHENMHARFQGHWVSLGFCQHDRFLLATPLYYGGGRGFSMSYLFCGGTVVLYPPPFEPSAVVVEAKRSAATTAFLVPTQLLRVLDLPCPVHGLLEGLRLLVSSGSALLSEERHAIRTRINPNFFDYYSSTEGGGISIQLPCEQDRYPDSVGRSIYLVEVQSVDESDRPLPPGEVGRIRYRGPGVAPGFHREPEAASGERVGAFFCDGWFYPGDLGCLDAKGYLYLRGRAKDVIIRGGVNIYPVDIEEVLKRHAGIRDAAVVGWPSRIYGEEVAAFVVPRHDSIDDRELIAHCRALLSPYKVPKAVFLIDELPRNASGKVL